MKTYLNTSYPHTVKFLKISLVLKAGHDHLADAFLKEFYSFTVLKILTIQLKCEFEYQISHLKEQLNLNVN